MSSSAELYGVPASDIPDVWPTAKRLLDRAIEMSGGELTPLSVLDSLLSRDMQLWLAVNGTVKAAMVTQIIIHPSGSKSLHLLLVGGGDMGEWVRFRDSIMDWARQHGCKRIVIPRGRKGWLRVFRDWTEKVYMEKEL